MEGAVALAAILGFLWARSYLHFKKRQQEREWLHRERMLAMEKGIPLPEFPAVEPEPGGTLLDYLSSQNIVPKFSLGLGVLLLFLGAGLLTALRLSPEPDIQDSWTFGFIPLFLGFGFLLYYWVARSARIQ